MPFHVEIRHSLRRARVFNLTEERLLAEVLDPWRGGGLMELGDHEWDPGDSELTILEGPELPPSELALGRGWTNAERSAADVTARMLREAAGAALAVAVIAESSTAEQTAVRILDELEIRRMDWPTLRANIASGQVASGVALLIIGRADPSGAWLFEAGLAIGALGRGAVVAQLGDGPSPDMLRGLAIVRLQPEDPASVQALADVLRRAGGVS